MLSYLRLLIFIALLSYVYANKTPCNPIVTTSLGKIQGSILTSVLGKQINAFRGIRYAKAPINELRFQPPVPVEQWDHIYDATKDEALCPQPVTLPISEDCLFLNVYSTKLPINGHNPKRPVFVFLHPGGFYAVGSSSEWAGPRYFLDQDIVLVTLNYRLGSLGFLSTGDQLAPGNNGLKDQVVALKWVRDNIAAFGGDPEMVTICGYSAGSISVTLHLISPMSRGLFHRAIAMSASAYGNWPIPTQQFHLAQKQARLVNCSGDTSANIINCLKTKSAKELGDSLYGFAEFGGDPILIWSAVIEPDFGQERFLSVNPLEAILKGNFVKVPIMVGVTTDEFAGAAFYLLQNPNLLKEMDDDFERVAPIAFSYERETERSKYISKELRKFYLGEDPLNNSSLTGLAQLYSDGLVGFAINRAAKILSAKNTEPVYYYRFNFKGRYSHYYLPGTNTPYGVVHHDDLIYMFNSKFFPYFNETYPEYAMVKKLTTMLANFAKTGEPIPQPTCTLDNTKWNKFSGENNLYLDIGEKLVMKAGLYQDRYALWEKLYPLPEYN